MAAKKAAKAKGKKLWVNWYPKTGGWGMESTTKKRALMNQDEGGILYTGILYPVPTKKRAVK